MIASKDVLKLSEKVGVAGYLASSIANSSNVVNCVNSAFDQTVLPLT